MEYSSGLGGIDIINWVFTGLLLLLALVSMAAGRGALGRNHGIGIRIPALFASDEAWQRGHAAAVRPSWIGFAVAIVLDVVGISVRAADWLVIVVFFATFVWVVVVARRAAKSG